MAGAGCDVASKLLLSKSLVPSFWFLQRVIVMFAGAIFRCFSQRSSQDGPRPILDEIFIKFDTFSLGICMYYRKSMDQNRSLSLFTHFTLTSQKMLKNQLQKLRYFRHEFYQNFEVQYHFSKEIPLTSFHEFFKLYLKSLSEDPILLA